MALNAGLREASVVGGNGSYSWTALAADLRIDDRRKQVSRSHEPTPDRTLVENDCIVSLERGEVSGEAPTAVVTGEANTAIIELQ